MIQPAPRPSTQIAPSRSAVGTSSRCHSAPSQRRSVPSSPVIHASSPATTTSLRSTSVGASQAAHSAGPAQVGVGASTPGAGASSSAASGSAPRASRAPSSARALRGESHSTPDRAPQPHATTATNTMPARSRTRASMHPPRIAVGPRGSASSATLSAACPLLGPTLPPRAHRRGRGRCAPRRSCRSPSSRSPSSSCHRSSSSREVSSSRSPRRRPSRREGPPLRRPWMPCSFESPPGRWPKLGRWAGSCSATRGLSTQSVPFVVGSVTDERDSPGHTGAGARAPWAFLG